MSTNNPHPLASTPPSNTPAIRSGGVSTHRFDLRGPPRFATLSGRPAMIDGDLKLAYGGFTSSVFSSYHISGDRLLTPPRQCMHKTRFSTHPSSLGGRPPPFNRHCATQILTYPCTLTPAPLHSHPNPPPQAPLKLRPYAPQTLTPFSLPTLQAGLGHVYTLARSQLTLTRRLGNRVSLLRQTYMRVSPYSASASGSRTHSKKATLSIKTRRLFCNDAAYGSMHSGQGDVGCGVCTSASGGGRVVEVSWALWSPRPAGLETCRPRVEDAIRHEGPHI